MSSARLPFRGPTSLLQGEVKGVLCMTGTRPRHPLAVRGPGAWCQLVRNRKSSPCLVPSALRGACCSSGLREVAVRVSAGYKRPRLSQRLPSVCTHLGRTAGTPAPLLPLSEYTSRPHWPDLQNCAKFPARWVGWPKARPLCAAGGIGIISSPPRPRKRPAGSCHTAPCRVRAGRPFAAAPVTAPTPLSTRPVPWLRTRVSPVVLPQRHWIWGAASPCLYRRMPC